MCVVKSAVQRKEPSPSLGEGAIPAFQLYPNIASGWEASVQGNAGAHLSPVHQGNLSITPAPAGTLPPQPTQLPARFRLQDLGKGTQPNQPRQLLLSSAPKHQLFIT